MNIHDVTGGGVGAVGKFLTLPLVGHDGSLNMIFTPGGRPPR